MILKNNNWEIEIDLNGGRIKSLKFKDKYVLGTFVRIDGKLGNTHVCVPNFGDEGKERELPFHGWFRGLEWTNIDFDTDRHNGLPLQENNEIVGIWCEYNGLRVEQIFKLGEKFSHKIIVKNIGNTDQIVNIASHNYWNIENTWVNTKINGVVVDEIIKSDDWYPAKERQLLEFDNKKIELELIGYNKLRLWTKSKEENGVKLFDQKYICIEPAINIEGAILKIGESTEVEQMIEMI